MPSTPENPVADEASPMDWEVIENDPKATVSVYSSPEKEPLP